MSQTKVLVVDDHTIVREGLSVLLESAPDFEVVGAVDNGREAVAAAEKTHPDIVLMDLAMPIMNGITATRLIRKHLKHTKILALSSYSDESAVNELLNAGACGYLLKESASADLLDAIRRVSKGGTAFSPAIEKRLRHEQNRQQLGQDAKGRSCALTARESQVLQLVAEGFTNKAIAAELQISIKTVEKHRQQVMDKLNIHDIAGLTRYAVANNMVTPPGQPPLT
jgi:DNA-binding NarL/FixJ family response regulator